MLYARVSAHDQQTDPDPQVARLSAWAAWQGIVVAEAVREVGSGMSGRRPPGEASGGLVSDMVEVLAGFCARLYGRCGAHNRVLHAVTCAKQLPGHRDGGGGRG